MKGFPDLPPLWLLAFLVLAWALARLMPLAMLASDPLRALGVAVALAGFGLILWSAIWFRRKRTTIEPHHAPSALIVEGPYRLGRNPIYLGMVLILVGEVLWLGALSPAILPPLLVLVLTRRFVRAEEAGLRAAFGEGAQAYLARTRRWL